MADPSDSNLLAALKDGERVAFRQIFDRYYKYLVVTIHNLSNDDQMAHDITQDVFLEIWKRRDKLEVSNLKSYLRRAAINKMLNRIKKNRSDYFEPSELPEQKSNISEPLEVTKLNNLQEAINKAMDQLPERCRMVFKLRRLEGLSVKEIAAELEISPKTVENQLTKAMKIMRVQLKDFTP